MDEVVYTCAEDFTWMLILVSFSVVDHDFVVEEDVMKLDFSVDVFGGVLVLGITGVLFCVENFNKMLVVVSFSVLEF